MVAGGDGVHTVAKQFRGEVGRNTVAAGGIFAIGDDHVEAVSVLQVRQNFLDRAPARTADDVADEEYFHAENLTTKDKKDTKEKGLQPGPCGRKSRDARAGLRRTGVAPVSI
jgi:hypothetical protein